jgi:hypothetical protein
MGNVIGVATFGTRAANYDEFGIFIYTMIIFAIGFIFMIAFALYQDSKKK